MKWKCLLIVSLVLIILAMGAVGASQSTAQDDNITATDLNEEIMKEDFFNDKLSENDFDVNITEETVDLDDENIENQSIVSFKIPENTKGEVSIRLIAYNTTETIDSTSYEFEKEPQGKLVNITPQDFRFNLQYIGPGDYFVKVRYYDGYSYTDIANGTITFKRTVTADNFKFKFNIDEKTETTVIDFEISPLSGNLTVYVNGEKCYSRNVSKGNNEFKIIQTDLEGLNAGENEISVRFISSEYGTVNLTQFTYFKRSNYTYIYSEFDVNYKYIEMIKIKDIDYLTGKVTVTIDGKNVFNKTLDGNDRQLDIYPQDLNLSGITYANHYIVVNYTKNSSQNIIGRNVLIYEAPHYYFPYYMHEGENEAIMLHICENYTGKVNVSQVIYPEVYSDPTIYFPLYYADLSQGYLRIPLNDIEKGNYKLKVSTLIDQIPNHSFDSYPDLIVKDNTEGFSSTISPQTISIGNKTAVTLTGPSSAKNAEVYVDGVKYGEYAFNSENIILNTNDLDIGKHYVSVKFSTAEYEVTYSETHTLIVSQYKNPNMNVSISKSKIKPGDEDVTINVTLPGDAKGKVDILMDNELVNSTYTTEGRLTVKIPSNYITAGSHDCTVYFNGDEQYRDVGLTSTIYVDMFTVEISENPKVGNNATITIKSPANLTGNFSIFIDGVIFDSTVCLINGEASLNVTGLEAGRHSYYIIYSGAERYESSSELNSFDVIKNDISQNISIDFTVPENTTSAQFKISLPSDATGYIFVDMGEKHVYCSLDNGNATILVSNLNPGNYSANITYTGDDTYYELSKVINTTIPSNVKESALTIPDSVSTETDPTFAANLPADAQGYLEVDVDGKKYVEAIENGTASITIPKMSAGNHDVTVTYTGDGKYAKISKSVILSVREAVVELTNTKAITAVYSAKATFNVLLTLDGKAANGKTVVINFNGKNYNIKTDSRGYAVLNVDTNVKPNTYKITATFNGIKVTCNVKINHVIVAKNKKVKKSKKVTKIRIATSKVNGKYLQSKTLKVKFKGKTYKIKTNKKGVATWKVKKSMLKKLKVGKKYKYTVSYGKDSITKKLTIKK